MKRTLRQLLSLLLTLALLLPAQAGADLNAIGHILSDMRMGGTCQTLRGDVELAVDGGDIPPDAQGSTVVDATGSAVRVLRPGPISF